MILNEHDSGRLIEMNVNEILVVYLQENPTTGYLWKVEETYGIEQVSDHFEPGGAIGAAGLRVFKFQINGIGLYELHIKNWREWEGDVSIINRFKVKIVVK
ncbi:protease inhibitor I42 family protein [Bacillus sp. GMa5/1]|uniref:protease inhibitor I42 family protein n=1 Tax=Bacillus sp. GMa5/1 TaxID=3418496 RepID=UPI003CEF76E7